MSMTIGVATRPGHQWFCIGVNLFCTGGVVGIEVSIPCFFSSSGLLQTSDGGGPTISHKWLNRAGVAKHKQKVLSLMPQAYPETHTSLWHLCYHGDGWVFLQESTSKLKKMLSKVICHCARKLHSWNSVQRVYVFFRFHRELFI